MMKLNCACTLLCVLESTFQLYASLGKATLYRHERQHRTVKGQSTCEGAEEKFC